MTLCALVLQHRVSCSSFTCTVPSAKGCTRKAAINFCTGAILPCLTSYWPLLNARYMDDRPTTGKRKGDHKLHAARAQNIALDAGQHMHRPPLGTFVLLGFHSQQ